MARKTTKRAEAPKNEDLEVRERHLKTIRAAQARILELLKKATASQATSLSRELRHLMDDEKRAMFQVAQHRHRG